MVNAFYMIFFHFFRVYRGIWRCSFISGDWIPIGSMSLRWQNFRHSMMLKIYFLKETWGDLKTSSPFFDNAPCWFVREVIRHHIYCWTTGSAKFYCSSTCNTYFSQPFCNTYNSQPLRNTSQYNRLYNLFWLPILRQLLKILNQLFL